MVNRNRADKTSGISFVNRQFKIHTPHYRNQLVRLSIDFSSVIQH